MRHFDVFARTLKHRSKKKNTQIVLLHRIRTRLRVCVDVDRTWHYVDEPRLWRVFDAFKTFLHFSLKKPAICISRCFEVAQIHGFLLFSGGECGGWRAGTKNCFKTDIPQTCLNTMLYFEMNLGYSAPSNQNRGHFFSPKRPRASPHSFEI